MSKTLIISSATAFIAPELFKVLAILPDHMRLLTRSEVDREDLNHTKNQKKGHISLGDQQSCYLQVFQRLY